MPGVASPLDFASFFGSSLMAQA